MDWGRLMTAMQAATVFGYSVSVARGLARKAMSNGAPHLSKIGGYFIAPAWWWSATLSSSAKQRIQPTPDQKEKVIRQAREGGTVASICEDVGLPDGAVRCILRKNQVRAQSLQEKLRRTLRDALPTIEHLTDRQRFLVECFVNSGTLREAALAAGVSTTRIQQAVNRASKLSARGDVSA